MDTYRDSHKDQWKKYEIMYSKNYDNFIWKLEQEVLSFVFKEMNEKSLVLDFACWTWRITSFLEKKFNNIDWVDISNDMLSVAKTKTSKVTYYLWDITRQLNLNKKYDIITAFRFFLNAEDKLRIDALKSIFKYLSKDWIFIFSNHWNKFSIRSIKIFLKKIIGIKKRNNELSHNKIKELLNTNWFKIKEYYPISFLPVFLYKILNYKTIKTIEKKIQKIKFFKLFAVDLIYIAHKKQWKKC